MRALLQRVTEARVLVGGGLVGEIGAGLLIFVGVEAGDSGVEIPRLVERVLGQRVFPDLRAPMNVSVLDTGGAVLLVSQFTLAANTRRGRRPSFSMAAPPEQARPLFDAFVAECRRVIGDPQRIATGQFGADMRVELINDGPVTLLLESGAA